MLGDKDLQILKELRSDARKKLTDISRATGIPTSTIHERLKFLLDQGMRLVTLLDYPRMHMPLQCWLFVKAKNKESTLEYLQELAFVNVLLVVNNGYDFAAECVFSTLKQQHTVYEALRRQGKVHLYPVIEELGRETVCPVILSQQT